MSYRRSNFRKLRKVVTATADAEHRPLTRTEMNRVLDWAGSPSLPRPEGWGKPKRKRAA